MTAAATPDPIADSTPSETDRLRAKIDALRLEVQFQRALNERLMTKLKATAARSSRRHAQLRQLQKANERNQRGFELTMMTMRDLQKEMNDLKVELWKKKYPDAASSPVLARQQPEATQA